MATGQEAPAKQQLHLLNLGIYDPAEVARLVHIAPDTLARWARPLRGHGALVRPVAGNLLTFLDLMSLRVIAELRRRGVPRNEISAGAKTLAGRLGTQWPLAHRDMATVGRGFFARFDEWVDAGKGGQGAFQVVVEPLLQRVEFTAEGLAAVWYPHDGVAVNPRVQAGAPCVRGTRMPTRTVHQLLTLGEEPEAIADDYRLSIDQVLAAEAFETSLAA